MLENGGKQCTLLLAFINFFNVQTFQGFKKKQTGGTVHHCFASMLCKDFTCYRQAVAAKRQSRWNVEAARSTFRASEAQTRSVAGNQPSKECAYW